MVWIHTSPAHPSTPRRPYLPALFTPTYLRAPTPRLHPTPPAADASRPSRRRTAYRPAFRRESAPLRLPHETTPNNATRGLVPTPPARLPPRPRPPSRARPIIGIHSPLRRPPTASLVPAPPGGHHTGLVQGHRSVVAVGARRAALVGADCRSASKWHRAWPDSFRELTPAHPACASSGRDEIRWPASRCPPSWFRRVILAMGPEVIVLFLMLHLSCHPWMGRASSRVVLACRWPWSASRVTGETDTDADQGLGPVDRPSLTVVMPSGDVTANVMGANGTGASACTAADRSRDLKSAWMVGANPRKQLRWLSSSAASPARWPSCPNVQPAHPEALERLGCETFPAPSAQVWAGVSQVPVAGPDACETRRARMARGRSAANDRASWFCCSEAAGPERGSRAVRALAASASASGHGPSRLQHRVRWPWRLIAEGARAPAPRSPRP
jgi:hypothetical protein